MSVLERGGERRPRLDLNASPGPRRSSKRRRASMFARNSPSGPSVRHYDRSGVSCPWGWELSRAAFLWRNGSVRLEEMHDPGRVPVEARDAIKSEIAAHEAPGDRHKKIRIGCPAPVSFRCLN